MVNGFYEVKGLNPLCALHTLDLRTTRGISLVAEICQLSPYANYL